MGKLVPILPQTTDQWDVRAVREGAPGVVFLGELLNGERQKSRRCVL
ncbi:MAG TPA: hypothetical protein VFZ27_03965 [Terriglobia bacterium]|nr:hypothetical protein [Terriglobia bacterium]